MNFAEAKELQKGEKVLCTYNDTFYLVENTKIDEKNKSVCIICDDGLGRHHTMIQKTDYYKHDTIKNRRI